MDAANDQNAKLRELNSRFIKELREARNATDDAVASMPVAGDVVIKTDYDMVAAITEVVVEASIAEDIVAVTGGTTAIMGHRIITVCTTIGLTSATGTA